MQNGFSGLTRRRIVDGYPDRRKLTVDRSRQISFMLPALRNLVVNKLHTPDLGRSAATELIVPIFVAHWLLMPED